MTLFLCPITSGSIVRTPKSSQLSPIGRYKKSPKVRYEFHPRTRDMTSQPFKLPSHQTHARKEQAAHVVSIESLKNKRVPDAVSSDFILPLISQNKKPN